VLLEELMPAADRRAYAGRVFTLTFARWHDTHALRLTCTTTAGVRDQQGGSAPS